LVQARVFAQFVIRRQLKIPDCDFPTRLMKHARRFETDAANSTSD
jgi:hypothetical protein